MTLHFDEERLADFVCQAEASIDQIVAEHDRDQAMRLVTQLSFSLIDAAAAQMETACAKSCAACCYQAVRLEHWELLPLLMALANLESERQALYVPRILDLGARADDLPPGWTAERRCPFLDDGTCGIYAFRPLACRTFASDSAERCASRLAGADVTIEAPASGAITRDLFVGVVCDALARHWGEGVREGMIMVDALAQVFERLGDGAAS